MEIDSNLNTPQKIPEMQDLFMIENLEKELECFSHLLEKSSEKGIFWFFPINS